MQTNDLIKELEKTNPHFAELDLDNNMWNGFSCDHEGAYLYEKHLNTLFIDYFNDIDNHTDILLANRSTNEIELFITNKSNRFKAIKDLFVGHDKSFYLNDIESLNPKIERAELGIWNENELDYQLYGEESLIRMKQHKAKSQLEYDYLNFKIDYAQLNIQLQEWLTHVDAEEDGWDEDSLSEHSCHLRMERICREYIDKSLKLLNEKYSYYLQQTQNTTSKETSNQSNTQQEAKLKYKHSEVLKNYTCWREIVETKNSYQYGYKNIFDGVEENTFFEMIDNADFSQLLNKKGISQRVRYNIYLLSRILGNDWGEKAAQKLNTNLRECGKFTSFPEFDELKKLYS